MNIERNNNLLIPRNSFRIKYRIINTILETLTSFGKRFAAALLRLFVRHDLCRDVIMMSAGFTRAGVFLHIIFLLILVNPLLAKHQSKPQKEKVRQQQQEERQTEFVKGKSKGIYTSYVQNELSRLHA